MKFLVTIFALLCVGCVSIPVPPFGEHRGQLGDVKISARISYIPKTSPEQDPTDSTRYAWEQFKLTKPKLLKDK